MNVLWFILDVANVVNLDLTIKLIVVQVVAIKLQGLQSHLSEIMIDLKLFFGKDENYTKSTVDTNMGANTVNHELSSKK